MERIWARATDHGLYVARPLACGVERRSTGCPRRTQDAWLKVSVSRAKMGSDDDAFTDPQASDSIGVVERPGLIPELSGLFGIHADTRRRATVVARGPANSLTGNRDVSRPAAHATSDSTGDLPSGRMTKRGGRARRLRRSSPAEVME